MGKNLTNTLAVPGHLPIGAVAEARTLGGGLAPVRAPTAAAAQHLGIVCNRKDRSKIYILIKLWSS